MEQIGRYRIVDELGRGAMGVVYRAEDPAIGRTVAIKTIRLGEVSEPSEREYMRERLLREARSAGILSHPGIVTIYDIAEKGDTAYIFMEYVNGDTLEKLISSETPLPKERIFEILRQTAAALDYAHAKGIVHRDIKPANIMISVDGEAKITDFGIAKILSQQMTQTRSILGTPYYMSPEQIQGAKIDGRADQFSLAVVSYELITGERPYSADSLPTLLYKIVQEAPVPPQRINPSLAPGVEKVLCKAFSKEPHERFFTCTEFVNALALAASKKPGWKPLPRGASSVMKTVDTVSPVRPPADELPGPAAGAVKTRISPLLEASLSPGPRRRRHLEEEEERERSSSLVRYAVLVILIAAVAAAGYFGYEKYLGPYLAANGLTGANQAATVSPPPPPPPPAPVPAAPSAVASAAGEEKAAQTQEPGASTTAAEAASLSVPAQPAPATRPASEPPRSESRVKLSRAAPAPAKAAPQPYWVQIRSHPPGAQVTADNSTKVICKTPCEMPLVAGRHVLRLTMSGHRLAPRIIQVPEVTDVAVNLNRMAGTLAIRSNPPGATIILNGERRSEKTPALIKLPAGSYHLRLTLPGHRPFNDTIKVKDQVITTIGINW